MLKGARALKPKVDDERIHVEHKQYFVRLTPLYSGKKHISPPQKKSCHFFDLIGAVVVCLLNNCRQRKRVFLATCHAMRYGSPRR